VPKIYPFRAWYYNPEKIADLSQVVSPPYDVISKDDQSKLYDCSTYNFSRIILTKETGDERYPVAASTLDQWVNEAVVIQDLYPAIYLIEQTYLLDGTEIIRTGIISECELEPLGEGIFPHEQTMEKHIEDRFRLMEETQTNTGQIFMSYSDEDRVIESIWEELKDTPSWQNCRTDDGVNVRMWAIRDSNKVHTIQMTLNNSKAIIADGHHRYKTALRYQNEHKDVNGSNRVMVTLVNSYNPGMLVLPTHRIINDVHSSPEENLSRISTKFEIQKVDKVEDALEILSGDRIQFGLVHKPSNQGWVLTYIDKSVQLDVIVFHDLVLKVGFDLDTTKSEDISHFSYLRGTSSPIEFIENEKFEWLGLVKPPTLKQIFDIAESGGVMPQKSTYFYPKMYSGILFRKF